VLLCTLVLGGPVHSFPPFFFSGAPLFQFFLFWRELRTPKNRLDRRQTKRGPFFAKMIIPPPHHRDFPIDLQQRWSINRKIGDRQCTYYSIVRALTVAVLLFFLKAPHSGAHLDVPIRNGLKMPNGALKGGNACGLALRG
jgi:hypothetical protein